MQLADILSHLSLVLMHISDYRRLPITPSTVSCLPIHALPIALTLPCPAHPCPCPT